MQLRLVQLALLFSTACAVSSTALTPLPKRRAVSSPMALILPPDSLGEVVIVDDTARRLGSGVNAVDDTAHAVENNKAS